LIAACVLVGVVPPDETACGCAERAMVTRIVTRYAADNSALEAASGGGGSGRRRQRQEYGSNTGKGSHLLTCCFE
jgi:hypothetical protein